MASITRSKRKNRNDQRHKVTVALLAATERLIAKGSRFTGLSIDTLSREAGIARSTYYMYFQDKGHLIRELTAQITVEVTASVQSWWSVAPQATRAQLHRSFLATMRVYLRHRAVLAALAETASYDATVQAAFEELLSTVASRSLEAVRPGQRAGTVRREVNLDTLLALVWMSERVAYRHLAQGGEGGLKRTAAIVTDIVWRTLYRTDA